MNTNPFDILRLDPSATEEQIVRHAARLQQRATDEAMRNEIRQAVQALTARSEDRQLLSLLTHPRPCYSCPALERFAAAFRRPPVPTTTPQICPPLDLEEFEDLVGALIREELDLSALPLEPIPADNSANELDRQRVEALWQSLLFDPGA